MKTIRNIGITISICMILTGLLMSFNNPEKKVDTKVFISTNSSVIQTNIDAYCKLGYRVTFLVPQSISYYGGTGTLHKSDIILIMEK